MNNDPRTSTDVIIEAMEQADDMELCVVVYRLKNNSSGASGCGWISNVNDRSTRTGLLDEARFLMLVKSYGIVEDSE